jgi:hypothetical protein
VKTVADGWYVNASLIFVPFSGVETITQNVKNGCFTMAF